MATVHANQILTIFMLLLGGHNHCVKVSSEFETVRGMGLWEFSGALRELMLTCLSPPVFFMTVPRQCSFCGSFLLFMFHVCLYYVALSFPCSLVINCWERANILSFLCVMFSCVLVTCPCLGLIVSIPDHCLLSYFAKECSYYQNQLQLYQIDFFLILVGYALMFLTNLHAPQVQTSAVPAFWIFEYLC